MNIMVCDHHILYRIHMLQLCTNTSTARKVQTFKDLSKPWAELPALLHSHSARASSPSSTHSTPRSSPHPSLPPSSLPPVPSSPPQGSEDLPRVHSALTTLLLDDSPRKAELQPYNHVCIPEYSGARRILDLQAFQNEKAALQALKDGNDEGNGALAEQDNEPENTPALENGDNQDPRDGAPAALEEPDNKKRKRKDKKAKKAAALAASIAEFQARRSDPYDHVLLAVIGVLEEVKTQGNVAAWIRSGGLWGTSEDGDYGDKHIVASRDNTLSADEDGMRDSKRTKGSAELLSLHAEPTGNDVISSTIPPIPAGPVMAAIGGSGAVNRADIENSSAPAPMWFENVDTVRRWADKGRKVLEEMGIPIVHGIER